MESSALPRRLLEHQVSCNATAGCIPVWRALLEDLNLPSISDLLANQRAHNSWKLATKRLLTIHSNLLLSVDCPLLPMVCAIFLLGSLPLTLTNTKKTRNNNFHIILCLLTSCDGLEADASHFRQRRNERSPNDPSCKLCEAPLEDSLHFIVSCPTLRECRAALLKEAPPSVKEALPDPTCNPDRFFNLIFGVEWLSDTGAQLYFVDFLNNEVSQKLPAYRPV